MSFFDDYADDARQDARGELDDNPALTRALRDARKWRCGDRSCGAYDCPTCRPGTWRQAVEDGLDG